MSKLHEALVAAGVESLDYADVKTDETITIPVIDLPDATIISQLLYGRRMFNDALNSGDQDDRAGRREELIKRLRDGWTRAHGGGKRLDPVEREAREVVVALMVEARFKASEARKLVSADGAETAFRANIADDTAKWEKVLAHAEKVAALKSETPSL